MYRCSFCVTQTSLRTEIVSRRYLAVLESALISESSSQAPLSGSVANPAARAREDGTVLSPIDGLECGMAFSCDPRPIKCRIRDGALPNSCMRGFIESKHEAIRYIDGSIMDQPTRSTEAPT